MKTTKKAAKRVSRKGSIKTMKGMSNEEYTHEVARAMVAALNATRQGAAAKNKSPSFPLCQTGMKGGFCYPPRPRKNK
jgi:hypothetical protein